MKAQVRESKVKVHEVLLIYVRSKVTYINESKMAFWNRKIILTYALVHRKYVSNNENQDHVRQSLKTRKLQKQCLTYVSLKLTYVRDPLRALFAIYVHKLLFQHFRTCVRRFSRLNGIQPYMININ